MRYCLLRDGRALGYTETGDPDGYPVVFNHGLANSCLLRNPDETILTELGVRLVAVDQPGVGGSSPLANRTLSKWARDVEQLLDSIGIGQFAVAGHSAGGAHALSLAYYLGNRVWRGAIFGSVTSPQTMPYSAQLNSEFSRVITELYPNPWGYPLAIASLVTLARTQPEHFLRLAMTLDRTDGDPAVFYRDETYTRMFAATIAAAYAQGGAGVTGTLEALHHHWGFSVADVARPFEVFHGTLDAVIRVAVAESLAEQLPNSTLRLLPNVGHYGLLEPTYWREFLRVLVS